MNADEVHVALEGLAVLDFEVTRAKAVYAKTAHSGHVAPPEPQVAYLALLANAVEIAERCHGFAAAARRLLEQEAGRPFVGLPANCDY